MEHSIQEVARAAGTTSRTLRHYDRIGLLAPARIGANGYRYYDESGLVRLQRILLLRELGLGLEAIGQVLDAQDAQAGAADPEAGSDAAQARILTAHRELLERERERIVAQIGAVERTIAALGAATAGTGGRNLMAENMFAGFDHTQYREEVEERWGSEAYGRGDRWWRGLSEPERADWQARSARLAEDWRAAAERGEDPASDAAQDLAARHAAWLSGVPGTPAAAPGGDLAGYLLGLGEMYVADERFAVHYGGTTGAVFVRDALAVYVERLGAPE
ncbi:MerR family transcriptional regulator [Leucobacter allii]|uniref:MerR family transcriptional regulator n=1 Tax=Leucobacter allii TaxID=2932247 RepID=UPI001FD1656C|nr:MerR family transcriptional regulator [Leucobacter allii]UOR01695.1 MerR family transcriptional regulator [Leucobacter allii]